MRKVLFYRGFKITITIKLNSHKEKTIDGDSFHLIKIEQTGIRDLESSIKVNSKDNLSDKMRDLEISLERDIDAYLRDSKSINETILEKMGYENI